MGEVSLPLLPDAGALPAWLIDNAVTPASWTLDRECGNLASVGIRTLTQRDATAARRFALSASFPPGRPLPVDAVDLPHVQRRLQGWGDELGVGWEEDGELRGAAWARRVEPVLVRDHDTGEPLPEVIISVIDDSRGLGIGTQLMQALLARAQAARYPGLALTVSEDNPVALRLYERVGFARQARTPSGLLTMVWRPRE